MPNVTTTPPTIDEQPAERPLRVCYFGTYRASYTRNQIILKGLQAQPDLEVYVCHATLWRGIEDRVEQASGGWRRPAFWRRAAGAYWDLLRAHRATPDYDVMLIGYPGQFDAYLGRALTWLRRRPMALDILMSLHLVAEERGLVEANPATGKLIFLLEKGGLRLPDRLIAENQAYQDYIAAKYGLPAERFRRVPHGADPDVYHPRPLRPPADHFRVTYHGGFLPSHGVETIIRAIALLRDQPDIHFEFYGTGPERDRAVSLSEELGLRNVTFHGFVSFDELLDGLARSHVCLGVFGTTRQSLFTVQNKVWEGLAMGRPVISGDSPTVREALVDGEQVLLIPREDPAALAAAILRLRDDPTLRESLAKAGYEQYLSHNTPQALGARMAGIMRELVEGVR